MRTVLVNRAKPSRSHRRAAATIVVARNAGIAPNRGRRRRRSAGPVVVVRARRRGKRNPMPMILPNRRRRRRNPTFSLTGGVQTVATGLAGGGITYAANKFLISKIGVDATGHDTAGGMWMRIGARALSGVLAGFFLGGPLGAAINGAMAYPAFQELDSWWASRGAAATGADLSDVEADLADVLDDLY